MNATQPPRTGRLMLERLGPEDASIVGDLAEEWGAGRSAFWYWRQVFAAVAFHCLADVRRHWIVVLRGIVTGLALLLALGWIVAPISVGLNTLLLRYALGIVVMQFQVGFVIHMAFWLPASVFAGWVVARLHKHCRATAVLGLVLTLGIFAICNERLYFLVRNSLTHERFVPYLTIHVLGTALGIAGVLVGGFMQPMTAQRPESNALFR
jgi:hypothetical protein